MKEKNKPVGTSPCPIKGCGLTVKVYKYRSRSDDPAKRRFAGRLYAECEKDGRVENQEFLLEHMKWDEPAGATEAPAAPVAAPEPKPQPTRAAPARPEKPAAAPAGEPKTNKPSNSWVPEFFRK
jgi:hypothetical protein